MALSHAIFGLTIALLVLTWTTVFLRLGVRLFMIRSFGWDDVFLILAQCTYTSAAILYFFQGEGVYSEADLLRLLTLVLVNPLLYILENIFMRMSLGLFFLRFLVLKWQRLYVYISIGIYTVYAVSFFIVVAVLFGDPHKLAEKMLAGECQGSSCGSWPIIGPMSYIQAALNTFIDITFAALPIFFIRKANMPLKTKLSVCALLGLGNISSIASIVRFPYIGDLNITEGVLPANTFVIATTIEQAAGLMALACAALRPLFALKLTSTSLGSRLTRTNATGKNTYDAEKMASQPTQRTILVQDSTRFDEEDLHVHSSKGLALGTMTTITAHDHDTEKGSNEQLVGSPYSDLDFR